MDLLPNYSHQGSGTGLGRRSKSARCKKNYSFFHILSQRSCWKAVGGNRTMGEIVFWWANISVYQRWQVWSSPMTTGLHARRCCNFKASCAFHGQTESANGLDIATRISENFSKQFGPSIYELYLVALSFQDWGQVAQIPKRIRNGTGKFNGHCQEATEIWIHYFRNMHEVAAHDHQGSDLSYWCCGSG